MFQTLSFCFRIGGPPPLIEEILWFGDIGLANLITQSRCAIPPNPDTNIQQNMYMYISTDHAGDRNTKNSMVVISGLIR